MIALGLSAIVLDVHLFGAELGKVNFMSLNMKTRHAHKEEKDHQTELKKTHTNNVKQAAECHWSLQLVGGTELSLEQLLQVCLRTNQEAFWTEFVRRSQPVIAGVVIKTIRNRTKPTADLVDDLVQETYVKLCCGNFTILRRFVPSHEGALHGFLKVVASNTVRDHFRKINNQKSGGGITRVPLDSIAALHVPKRPFEVFEHSVLLREIYKSLQDICADSPNSERDLVIFLLYYRQGLTTEAISRFASVGLGLKGVESALLRMVRLIKLRMRNRRT